MTRMKDSPTEHHLLLRKAGKVTQVVHVPPSAPSWILFEGPRVAAKKFLREFRTGTGWENIPAYCAKKSGELVLIP